VAALRQEEQQAAAVVRVKHVIFLTSLTASQSTLNLRNGCRRNPPLPTRGYHHPDPHYFYQASTSYADHRAAGEVTIDAVFRRP
jgi:hypothetical protein